MKPPAPETPAAEGLWAALLDVLLIGLIAALAVDRWAPWQDVPWKPLRLADPIGWATGVKLARAAEDPALCRAVLRDGGVSFAEARETRDGFCTTRNSLRLSGGATPLSPGGPVMTCQMALAYAFWDRHAVQPAARAELDAEVARVDHLGTYACRNVYGRVQGRPSHHAFANALDVAGFTLEDGRRVTVLGDFRREDARGRFLRRVRDEGCGLFRAVLSPDYNAAHRDHLHLDFGGYRVCR